MDSIEKFHINRELQSEAAKQGLIDCSAGLLANRSDIYVTADGTVFGADAAVSELLKTKPHLARASEPEPQTTQPGLLSAEDKLQAIGKEEMAKRLVEYRGQYGGSDSRDQLHLDRTFQPPGKKSIPNQNDTDQKRIRDFQNQYL